MNQGYRADQPQSYFGVAAAARLFRSRAGLPSKGPLPRGLAVFELLDQLRIELSGGAIPVKSHVEGIQREGLTRYRSEPERFELVLDEATFDRLERFDDPRARFTLAHEIGHVVLHPRLLLRMSEIPHEKRSELMRGGAKHQAFYDTEWQSNAFAGALLIPTESLRSAPRETLVPWIIANEFGCSQRCASIRLGVFQKYSC